MKELLGSFIILLFIPTISFTIDFEALEKLVKPESGAFANYSTSKEDGTIYDVGLYYQWENVEVKFYFHHNYPVTRQNFKHRVQLFAEEKYLIDSGLIFETNIRF